VNNWKVIFATVVIFGAGVITGGLLVNYVQHSRLKPAKRPPAVVATSNADTNRPTAKQLRSPELLSKEFLQKLNTELGLSETQHEAVQKIINEGQNFIRKIIKDSRLEIREVLTPEQCDQFDELIKRPSRRPLFNTNAPSASLAPTLDPLN